MEIERNKLHRTISSPNPEIHTTLKRLSSQTDTNNPELKTKLSIHSCPEEEED